MQMEELTAGHGVLTAVRAGQGPDLVILHSLLADRHAFDAVLPDLTRRFRVTLINLPGFHGSEPTVLPLLDAYLARLEGGFQEFAIGPDAILLGNGFGGTLALAFAIDHPKRIGKLIVSDAAATFPAQGRQAFHDMAERIASGDIDAVAAVAAKRVFSPAFLAQHPDKVDDRKQVLLGIDPRAFHAACKILAEIDLVPLLDKLVVPTLVVCGEADQATPPALNKEIAGRISGARYVELPGCGHCPPLEQPQPFLTAIRDFVGM
ncbi:MAG TPA: alpha/beta fold hydrolase [Pseudolabrys sp.]|nr:alpha/beta fold hydrolase [Pseudolabrys sp.]